MAGQLAGITGGFRSQISGLQSQINDNRWEARGGVALALPASGLRFDARPGKLSLAGVVDQTEHASATVEQSAKVRLLTSRRPAGLILQ